MNETHDSLQLVSSVLEDFKGMTPAYELRRTLELTVKGIPVRVEVWYCHTNQNAPWSARLHTRGEKPGTWKESELPSTDDRNEDAALRMALTFIEEQNR